jgi:hypothetical protein
MRDDSQRRDHWCALIETRRTEINQCSIVAVGENRMKADQSRSDVKYRVGD